MTPKSPYSTPANVRGRTPKFLPANIPARAKRGERPNKSSRRVTPKGDVPRCGLCGSRKKLTKTPCCGEWICDDHDQYELFSYATNSCSRNHNRYTLCGYHYEEGHQGSWQDCARCREDFETEMYVWYGTNEYNFEKLRDPPAFKPTKCAKCGTRIRLGEGGFSVQNGKYFCMKCSDFQF